VPVVAANRGALPEVGGDAVAYVQPDDPDDMAETIAQILASPERRAGMRARGITRARLFSWRASATRLWDGYREALARRKAR
jgi:glycosyltransferase involved in cell wall biosynthesis